MKPLLFAVAVSFVAIGLCAAPAFADTATSSDFLRGAGEELASGHYVQAIGDYSQAIRLRLDDPAAWFGRGQALTAVGRFRDAIDDFDQAIRLRPGFADAYLARGFAYGQAGDFTRGLEDLNRVLALEPSRPRALMLRGEAYSRLGQLEPAIADFSAALAAQSGSASDRVRLLLGRSRSYALLGQNQAALDDRNEAVRLAPSDPEVYLARGGSLHEVGLHEQGLADRTEAIRLKPDFVEAWYARGSAYFLLGDYQKASQDLREALRLNPGYAEARDVLEKAQIEIAKDALGLKPTPAVSAAALSPRIIGTAPQSKDSPSSESSFLRMIAMRQTPPQGPETSSPASPGTDTPAFARSAREESSQASPSQPLTREPSSTESSAAATPVAASTVTASPGAKSSESDVVVPVAPVFLAVIRQVLASLAPPASASQADSSETVTVTPASKLAASTKIVTPDLPASPAVTRTPDSRSADAHNQRGRDLIQQGKYREAVDELTVALSAQPEFALALNARGFAYVLLQDWPHAIADLDAALRLDPQYANAYHNRAVAKRGAGDAAGSAADEAKSRQLLAKQ